VKRRRFLGLALAPFDFYRYFAFHKIGLCWFGLGLRGFALGDCGGKVKLSFVCAISLFINGCRLVGGKGMMTVLPKMTYHTGRACG
jgi:hypothetical protein